MKRNWDLIRKLLLDLEEEKDAFSDTVETPKWLNQNEEDYKREFEEAAAINAQIFGHLELLLENGYADGFQVIRSTSGQFYYAITAPRLTMAGHDLLDTMRSPALWARRYQSASHR